MSSAFREFQKEYWNQSVLFFDMYCGIKKAMDFWVADNRFDVFVSLCNKYNILYLTDVKFVPLQDNQGIKKKVIWWGSLTSTKFMWEDIQSEKKWNIHVVLSMSQKHLDDIYKYAWYPIISDGRVLHKSQQDIQDFGDALWYPHCCRKFFFEKNNWNEYSFLYEIYKKSQVFDYRCNCFWKDNPYGEGYSYIYHMPCNFWCETTIEYAKQVEQKLLEQWEQDFLQACQDHLKLPCLVVREQKIYAFKWQVNKENNEISYSKSFFLWNPKEWNFSEYLEKWNRIQIQDKKHIHIYPDAQLIYSYDAYHQDEIEIPFIIQFQ